MGRKRNICAVNKDIQCQVFKCGCEQTFARQGDLTRHRCFSVPLSDCQLHLGAPLSRLH